ncbi:MAG: PaaI family thioesterase [Acidobacteria bacterium]|nr:PaaI family thioesterase [Acidobacteriota bacterium]
MSIEERRVRAASQLRELGHEFVSRELSDEQLEVIEAHITQLFELVSAGEPRRRVLSSGLLADFKMAVPEEGQREPHQLFGDSIVSGGANPMGLGGSLWREGNTAVMEVTLGQAFEGAPGRAHGGIVAALIDETMGLVLAINDELAFTAQLDITYVAPTPINQPITARAWLEQRDGRKLSISAKVEAVSVVIAEAKALFISVDPQKFLERLSSATQ